MHIRAMILCLLIEACSQKWIFRELHWPKVNLQESKWHILLNGQTSTHEEDTWSTGWRLHACEAGSVGGSWSGRSLNSGLIKVSRQERIRSIQKIQKNQTNQMIQKPLLVYTCLHLALILPRSPGCCRDVRKGSVGISSGQIDVEICWDLENGANYSVLVPTAGIITDVLWQLARTAVCGRAANHVCSRLWTCFFACVQRSTR